jgi:uncharacterized protein (DUF433 family)
MANSASLIGIGLYTVPEASRLVHISVPRIRRWLTGYVYRSHDRLLESAPLWTPQVPRFGSEPEMGFRDLMELRFVDAFVQKGLSLQAVRRALAKARALFGDERPLSTQRFRTDGRAIFLEIAGEIDDPLLFDLKKDQYLFHRIVAPSFKDIDFEDGVPVRWWPMSSSKGIVLDPKRCFGKPIVGDFTVPTSALSDAYKVSRSFKTVAGDYQVSERAVREAVRFEGQLAS